MNPPKSILDPSFKYHSAATTDIKKTFARERRRLMEQAAASQVNVLPITLKKPAGITRAGK